MDIIFRNLLARYIHHVGQEAGTQYLDKRHSPRSCVSWSEADWARLQKLRENPPCECKDCRSKRAAWYNALLTTRCPYGDVSCSDC